MKKQKFVALIRNYNNIEKEDLNTLIELEKLYPYSQAIHHLIAKSSVDLKSKYAKLRLNKAALYATDRTILKALIENKIDFGTVTSINEKRARESIEQKPASLEKQPPSTHHEAIVALRKDVIKNLKELQITKKYYLKLFEEKYPDTDLEEIKGKALKVKTNKKAPKGKAIKKPGKKIAKDKRAKSVSVNVGKGKILDKDSAKTTKVSKTKTRNKKSTKVKKASKTAQSKEKKNPKINSDHKNIVIHKPKSNNNPTKKQKEEINIINQFIKADPKIEVTSVDEKSPIEDLAKNSQQFNDELISENLAQIMKNQGKTKQAINIYKKLIWKFPQKKSYFAAQIDKIKKS